MSQKSQNLSKNCSCIECISEMLSNGMNLNTMDAMDELGEWFEKLDVEKRKNPQSYQLCCYTCNGKVDKIEAEELSLLYETLKNNEGVLSDEIHECGCGDCIDCENDDDDYY